MGQEDLQKNTHSIKSNIDGSQNNHAKGKPGAFKNEFILSDYIYIKLKQGQANLYWQKADGCLHERGRERGDKRGLKSRGNCGVTDMFTLLTVVMDHGCLYT